MPPALQPGQFVHTLYSGLPCRVEAFLGEGTQAEVYRANLDGTANALKWYKPEYIRIDDRLRIRLHSAIHAGPPTDKFLWPFDLVAAKPNGVFAGYLMPLKDPQFVDLVQLLRRKADPTFRILATTGLNLAHSFLELHTLKGLCYRDMSVTNVFFDPRTGDVRIGDNDNVDINGQAGAIRGTPGFMAPEVDRLEAEPSRITDLHALAVLLFEILMIAHPLKGRKEFSLQPVSWDPDGTKRLYGMEPVFIFDPVDHSNHPVPGHHDAALNFWPVYPRFLQRMFTRAFTEGLKDPDKRPTENEWRRTMCRLRDAIFPCQRCGAENFYDLEHLRESGGVARPCWACQTAVQLPPRIRLGAEVVMLSPGTQLYPHHTEGRLYQFAPAIADVVAEPLRLRNVSNTPWTTGSGESVRHIATGDTVPLAAGITIDFGRQHGEIRV